MYITGINNLSDSLVFLYREKYFRTKSRQVKEENLLAMHIIFHDNLLTDMINVNIVDFYCTKSLYNLNIKRKY